MHELSIIENIIAIAEDAVKKEAASHIEEIELDIGLLACIDFNAFDFVWRVAVKGTVLQSATRKVNRIEGQARCRVCHQVFPLNALYEPCNKCGSQSCDTIHGKELSVKQIIVNLNH